MMVFVAAALAVCAGSLSAAELFSQPAESDITHHVEHIATPNIELETPDLIWGEGGGLGDVVSNLSRIVNTGYHVWRIVENNRAAVSVNRTYANAIPSGLKSMDLEGFSEMKFESFRMHGTNHYGATVYDVSYTLGHRYNGNVDGKGRYLENVTVVPHEIKSLWGYRLNMSVVKASAVNVGTKHNPVGSVLLELSLRISTVVKAHEVTKMYEFRGDSDKAKELKAEPAKI